jgi:hypothetical protein
MTAKLVERLPAWRKTIQDADNDPKVLEAFDSGAAIITGRAGADRKQFAREMSSSDRLEARLESGGPQQVAEHPPKFPRLDGDRPVPDFSIEVDPRHFRRREMVPDLIHGSASAAGFADHHHPVGIGDGRQGLAGGRDQPCVIEAGSEFVGPAGLDDDEMRKRKQVVMGRLCDNVESAQVRIDPRVREQSPDMFAGLRQDRLGRLARSPQSIPPRRDPLDVARLTACTEQALNLPWRPADASCQLLHGRAEGAGGAELFVQACRSHDVGHCAFDVFLCQEYATLRTHDQRCDRTKTARCTTTRAARRSRPHSGSCPCIAAASSCSAVHRAPGSIAECRKG